jgi:hypothetical protein
MPIETVRLPQVLEFTRDPVTDLCVFCGCGEQLTNACGSCAACGAPEELKEGMLCGEWTEVVQRIVKARERIRALVTERAMRR